jgi:tetratricopeptide (TPR) repeat protein
MSESEMLNLLGPSQAPGDPCELANAAFRQGLYRRGLALVNRALRQDLGLEQVWLFKGAFLKARGFRNSHREMLRLAVVAGAPASLLVNYGNLLFDEEKYHEAAQAHRDYLEREPNGTVAALAEYNQANALYYLGEGAEAERLYRCALARGPGPQAFSYMLARLLTDQQRPDEALAVIEQGLSQVDTDPFTARLLEHKAYLLAEQERGEESLRSSEQALALADSVSAHYLRGRALALLGRLEDARLEIQDVLARQPENREAQRALRMIQNALGRD